MTGMTDHVCKNILYKNLSSPRFKEYYTLEEINEELKTIENSQVEPHSDSGEVLTNVVFHMDYKSFLLSLNGCFEDDTEEGVADRIFRFMELAMVK